METVYKYDLEIVYEQTVQMPAGAVVLTVQMQHDRPRIWVRCDPSKPTVDRKFYTHGTGHRIMDVTAQYVGTYQTHNGALVLHVFEGGQ